MTLAASTAVEFSIADLILLAHRKAALVGPYQSVTLEQQTWAARELQTIVDGLATKGLFAKTIEFMTLELESGVFRYDVDDDAIDVVGPGMYLDPSQVDLTQASGETLVAPMGRDEWQTNSAKNATSQPTKYYLHRDASPPVLYLWPVPGTSEDGGHIRFEKHRLRASNLDPTRTMDFERYWNQFFTYRLAHELALGSGLLSQAAYLLPLAEQAKQDCIGYSKQRPNQRFVVRHSVR